LNVGAGGSVAAGGSVTGGAAGSVAAGASVAGAPPQAVSAMLAITSSENRIYSLLCFTFLLLRESIEFQHIGKRESGGLRRETSFQICCLTASLILKLQFQPSG
jgi:hypothetical protein